MNRTAVDTIKEIVDRQRQVLLREREEIDGNLAQNEARKPTLESLTAGERPDPKDLRELDEVATLISRDRWRREWIVKHIDGLNRLEEEVLRAAQEKEMEVLSRALQEVREARQKIEGEEIPSLDAKLENCRREISRLEARAVEISDRLSGLRRGSTSETESQK
jgi:chromosome segregation ATPase